MINPRQILTLGAAIALPLLLGNCQRPHAPAQSANRQSSTPESGGQPIRSTDGTLQVTVPRGWDIYRYLNPDADLQVADLANEQYMIVLMDERSPDRPVADFTLEEHANATLTRLTQRLSAVTVSEPTAVRRVGPHRARQVEVRGELDGVAVVYLHTTVETQRAFYQILAWSAPDQFETQRQTLQTVIDTFEEVLPPALPAPPSNDAIAPAPDTPPDPAPPSDDPTPEAPAENGQDDDPGDPSEPVSAPDDSTP
jgi:hypothetical protein